MREDEGGDLRREVAQAHAGRSLLRRYAHPGRVLFAAAHLVPGICS